MGIDEKSVNIFDKVKSGVKFIGYSHAYNDNTTNIQVNIRIDRPRYSMKF